MKKLLAAGAALFLVFAPLISYGAEFKAGDSYKLRGGQAVEGNLYAAGGNVSIEGAVQGDLVAAGGTVLVRGPVKDDVMIAGGTVQISGPVGGDIRVAGGNVTIESEVKGEVIAAGGTVTFLSGSVVSGDVILGGGQVSLAGEVRGNLRGGAGVIDIDGNVRGDVDLNVDEKIIVSEAAVIEGDFAYRAPKKAEIKEGAEIRGTTDFKERVRGETRDGARRGVLAFLTAWFLAKMLVVIAAGLAALWLARSYLQASIDRAYESFGKEILRGFVALVATPVAAIILMITVLGLIPGAALLLGYGTLLVLAKVGAAALMGSVIERAITKKHVVVSWKTIVSGAVIGALLGLIPFVGWAIVLVFYLAALGTWSALMYERLRG